MTATDGDNGPDQDMVAYWMNEQAKIEELRAEATAIRKKASSQHSALTGKMKSFGWKRKDFDPLFKIAVGEQSSEREYIDGLKQQQVMAEKMGLTQIAQLDLFGVYAPEPKVKNDEELKETAYKAGQLAGRLAVDKSENPHADDPMLSPKWLEGWIESQQEIARGLEKQEAAAEDKAKKDARQSEAGADDEAGEERQAA